eukprot:gene23208-24583_t
MQLKVNDAKFSCDTAAPALCFRHWQFDPLCPGAATMSLLKTSRELVDEANAVIETIPTAEAIALAGRDDVVFVDLRDVRELEREGLIPGSFHATRGMIEFWIDPSSPYFKEIFGSGKRFVFYCQSGWRSALT